MNTIYFFVPYLPGYGGTESVLKNLFFEFNRSDQRSLKMKLICIGGYENGDWLSTVYNLKVIKLSSNKKVRTLQYICFLPFIMFKQLKQVEDTDVVVATNPVMWTLAYIYKIMYRRKNIVSAWYHYSLYAKPIKKLFLRCSDVYLAISSGIANELKNNGIQSKKIRIIYNPVIRTEMIVGKSHPECTREFLYVGRVMLDGQKNLRFMLDALSCVTGKWQLRVLGNGDIDKVRHYARLKGIESKIMFEGFKENVWEHVNSVDAVLLSSKFEGFPMVLNEAISVGVPVISVRCPTGPEDIVNCHNGVLVEVNNLKNFSDAVQQFIDGNTKFTNPKDVKQSIDKFYGDNYFKNFLKALELN